MREGSRRIDLSTRVPWVAGDLAARTLATTRLAECWIHTGDVADPLGVVRIPGARLKLIARLAWRTLPYAFARAGRKLSGPVAFVLAGPLGERWDFVPDRSRSRRSAATPSTCASWPGAELTRSRPA